MIETNAYAYVWGGGEFMIDLTAAQQAVTTLLGIGAAIVTALVVFRITKRAANRV